MSDRLRPVTDEKIARHSGPPKSRSRPYDNRPRSGPGRATRRTSSETNAVRVVLPGEPPRLTHGAARALLRILLKAYDQLIEQENQEGAAE